MEKYRKIKAALISLGLMTLLIVVLVVKDPLANLIILSLLSLSVAFTWLAGAAWLLYSSIRSYSTENTLFGSFLDACLYSVYKNRELLLKVFLFFFLLFFLTTASIYMALYVLSEPDIKLVKNFFLFDLMSGITASFLLVYMLVAKAKFQKGELRYTFKEQLDPDFVTNYPVHALRSAFAIFESHLKEKTKLDGDYGRNLIIKAFGIGIINNNTKKAKGTADDEKIVNEKKPRLIYSEDSKEQDSLSSMVQGVYAFYRNNLMHNENAKNVDKHVALVILYLLDELTQIVDKCELRETKEEDGTTNEEM